MRTLDNTTKSFQLTSDEVNDLAAIASRTVAELRGDNPALLAFPDALDTYRSGEDKALRLFSLHCDGGDTESLTTGNVMGFVGRNDTQLTIASRFAIDDNRDFFLHHMLQKVFRLNIVDFDVSKDDRDPLYDFLLYLFPSHLLPAMRQGLYKEYRRIEHNDANVKGTIDVARHLRRNIPFAGKIAYNTREYRYDNAVTQLVRHTVEHIKAHPWGRCILHNCSDMSDAVNQIEFHTPDYNRNERRRIINANLTRPVRHPYFTEWRRLQQLCLRILRHDKLTFGADKDKVYGLIFDGAWLWEEYLNVILASCGWDHPDSWKQRGGTTLFKERKQPLYADFLKGRGKNGDSAKYVADAKYMFLDKYKGHENSEKTVAVYYKTITYMYRFGSKHGFLFYPFADNSEIKNDTLTIPGPFEGRLTQLGLPIPKTADAFSTFSMSMKTCENAFLNRLAEMEGRG